MENDPNTLRPKSSPGAGVGVVGKRPEHAPTEIKPRCIPIGIVLSVLSRTQWQSYYGNRGFQISTVEGAGLLVLAPALMIVFRQKYPRWWFDWNVQLLAFSNRVYAYAALIRSSP